MKTILILLTLMAATLSYGQMTRDRGAWMPADNCCHMNCCADKCCGSNECCGKCGGEKKMSCKCPEGCHTDGQCASSCGNKCAMMSDKMHCGTAESHGNKSSKWCGSKGEKMNCSKGEKSCDKGNWKE